MQEEGQEYGLQSAAQHIVAPTGLNEEDKTHKRSSATTRGGKYSGSALRGHWNNTRTAYNNEYCNGIDHTYYRGDRGYGNNNSGGYYTGVGPENYGNNSCGYEVHEANDGYGNDNSEGEYAYANIENYNDGSCGYT